MPWNMQKSRECYLMQITYIKLQRQHRYVASLGFTIFSPTIHLWFVIFPHNSYAKTD